MIIRVRTFEDGILVQEHTQEFTKEEYLDLVKYDQELKKEIRINELTQNLYSLNLN